MNRRKVLAFGLFAPMIIDTSRLMKISASFTKVYYRENGVLIEGRLQTKAFAEEIEITEENFKNFAALRDDAFTFGLYHKVEYGVLRRLGNYLSNDARDYQAIQARLPESKRGTIAIGEFWTEAGLAREWASRHL
jgi:hypothetical protein